MMGWGWLAEGVLEDGLGGGVGAVGEALGEGGVVKSEASGGEQGGVDGARCADGEGSNGYAGGHLDDA